MYNPESEDFYETDNPVLSNFDGVINDDVVNELKINNCYASYTGYNFYAKVWFGCGEFHCKVFQYGSSVADYSAESIEEIRSEVCSEFGCE